ncbi:MAG: riboflavin synthase [Ignavibacteriales bacterium]
MFTGIVKEIGTIRTISFSGNINKLRIECCETIKDAGLGDSIAVNGICLTVCNMGDNWFEADVMPETMRRTSLAGLKPSSKVNLEPALKIGDRLGGHLVTGHIDGVGKTAEIKKEQNAVWINFETSSEILKYIVEKGSVAIDGTSLTVADVDGSTFSVSLIPATLENTILGMKKIGDLVDIECDIVGKYIEKFLGIKGEKSKEKKELDIEFFTQNGFI